MKIWQCLGLVGPEQQAVGTTGTKGESTTMVEQAHRIAMAICLTKMGMTVATEVSLVAIVDPVEMMTTVSQELGILASVLQVAQIPFV